MYIHSKPVAHVRYKLWILTCQFTPRRRCQQSFLYLAGAVSRPSQLLLCDFFDSRWASFDEDRALAELAARDPERSLLVERDSGRSGAEAGAGAAAYGST